MTGVHALNNILTHFSLPALYTRQLLRMHSDYRAAGMKPVSVSETVRAAREKDDQKWEHTKKMAKEVEKARVAEQLSKKSAAAKKANLRAAAGMAPPPQRGKKKTK